MASLDTFYASPLPLPTLPATWNTMLAPFVAPTGVSAAPVASPSPLAGCVKAERGNDFSSGRTVAEDVAAGLELLLGFSAACHQQDLVSAVPTPSGVVEPAVRPDSRKKRGSTANASPACPPDCGMPAPGAAGAGSGDAFPTPAPGQGGVITKRQRLELDGVVGSATPPARARLACASPGVSVPTTSSSHGHGVGAAARCAPAGTPSAMDGAGEGSFSDASVEGGGGGGGGRGGSSASGGGPTAGDGAPVVQGFTRTVTSCGSSYQCTTCGYVTKSSHNASTCGNPV